MATVTAKITLGLPDDTDADQVLVYSSATEDGTFTLDSTNDYTFGQEVLESISIDTTKWYKISFNNSVTSVEGTQSIAREGATWEDGKPFFALTSFYDGNPLATAADVYARTPHDSTDVPEAAVDSFLITARARVNLILDEQERERYTLLYDSDVARRKYNAQLQIMKDSEIYFAMSLFYKYLADNQVENAIAGTNETVVIGSTSISAKDSGTDNTQTFEDRAKNYEKTAIELLKTVMPNGIPVTYNADTAGASKFLHPTTGLRIKI
jgi:hypothetical protein